VVHRHVNFGVAAFHSLHAVWRVNTQDKNGVTMGASIAELNLFQVRELLLTNKSLIIPLSMHGSLFALCMQPFPLCRFEA
jgi:hypothetical protein